MRKLMNVTKALADENRVRILTFLRDKELCLCQIIEMLQLRPATVSKHMSILVQAELVDCRKDGRWRYYHLPAHPLKEADAAIAFVAKALERSPFVRQDLKRLQTVLQMDKEELCRHYKK